MQATNIRKQEVQRGVPAGWGGGHQVEVTGLMWMRKSVSRKVCDWGKEHTEDAEHVYDPTSIFCCIYFQTSTHKSWQRHHIKWKHSTYASTSCGCTKHNHLKSNADLQTVEEDKKLNKGKWQHLHYLLDMELKNWIWVMDLDHMQSKPPACIQMLSMYLRTQNSWQRFWGHTAEVSSFLSMEPQRFTVLSKHILYLPLEQTTDWTSDENNWRLLGFGEYIINHK